MTTHALIHSAARKRSFSSGKERTVQHWTSSGQLTSGSNPGCPCNQVKELVSHYRSMFFPVSLEAIEKEHNMLHSVQEGHPQLAKEDSNYSDSTVVLYSNHLENGE